MFSVTFNKLGQWSLQKNNDLIPSGQRQEAKINKLMQLQAPKTAQPKDLVPKKRKIEDRRDPSKQTVAPTIERRGTEDTRRKKII